MAEMISGNDGLWDPRSGLETQAYRVPKEDPIIEITDETLELRTAAFQTLLEELDGVGKLVSPVSGQRLAQMYGEDVIQAALDSGIIGMG